MGIDIALDELYASGWMPSNDADCSRHTDGRSFPSPRRVAREFSAAGCDLSIEHIESFGCYRAKWADVEGNEGTVVGHSENEAAVYALAHMRRQTAVIASA